MNIFIDLEIFDPRSVLARLGRNGSPNYVIVVTVQIGPRERLVRFSRIVQLSTNNGIPSTLKFIHFFSCSLFIPDPVSPENN